MNTDWFSALDDRIHRNSAEQIAFLQSLVRANSANPHTVENSTADSGIESEVAALIADQLRALGLQPLLSGASPARPNVLAVLKGAEPGERSLILNGHMDTVMPSSLWTVDPFGGLVAGNRMVGLGALDMKASLAMFVFAARALRESGIQLRGDLILTFVVDEEPGGSSPFGTSFLLENGLTATSAIVAEPGNDNVTIGHRGGYRFKLTVHGEAAHTGLPVWETRERGRNAITGMAQAALALDQVAIPYHETAAFPNRKPVLTFPTLIQGGTSINAVPDTCVAYGDVRLLPGCSEATIEAVIRARLDAIDGLRYTLEKLLFVPAVQIDPSEAIVQALVHRTTEVLGIQPTALGCGPWNDGWMFISRGIPAVCGFGPMGDGVHSPDEFVDLDSLIDTTRILVRAIVDYLGVVG